MPPDLFRSVFAAAADAMLILDDGRRVVDANEAACALFRLPAAELTARTLDTLMAGDAPQLDTAWRELLAFGEARVEHRVVSDGRAPRLVECSYRAAVQAGRHLCIARDVTDRRALEERMMEWERSRSVERLAGGVAHDFNNLLTAILGYTELLIDARAEGDPERADLEEIQKAGQRASSLTRQLLAYSRRQVLLPKVIDMNTVVAAVLNVAAPAIREDISLTSALAPEPALAKIDPIQVEQVILNLVLNSRDALRSGGHIRVEVAHVRLADVDVPCGQQACASKFVRVRVIDNGVGIAPEVRAHLFEPFFTTKGVGQGTGLGLASVYGIVRQSNGFITVESEPGCGATFTMHFPAVGSPAHADAAAGPAARDRKGAATILLVDDEAAVRAVSGAVLRRQGYTVLEAAAPCEACDTFERRRGEIDLLLTDVVLPEMNGPALAERLTALKPHLRVVFMSGYGDPGGSPERTTGRINILSKPFQASALAAKVQEALAAAPYARIS